MHLLTTVQTLAHTTVCQHEDEHGGKREVHAYDEAHRPVPSHVVVFRVAVGASDWVPEGDRVAS